MAGLVVATVGNRRKVGLWYWLCASSLALLTGAMGCACMGYSGVIALGLGFGAGIVPGLLRRAFEPVAAPDLDPAPNVVEVALEAKVSEVEIAPGRTVSVDL